MNYKIDCLTYQALSITAILYYHLKSFFMLKLLRATINEHFSVLSSHNLLLNFY